MKNAIRLGWLLLTSIIFSGCQVTNPPPTAVAPTLTWFVDDFSPETGHHFQTLDGNASQNLGFLVNSANEIDVSFQADEAYAPGFPDTPTFCQWSFADPLAVDVTDLERQRALEQVFRQILRRVSLFVALPLHSMRPSERRAAGGAMDEHPSAAVSLDVNP